MHSSCQSLQPRFAGLGSIKHSQTLPNSVRCPFPPAAEELASGGN